VLETPFNPEKEPKGVNRVSLIDKKEDISSHPVLTSRAVPGLSAVRALQQLVEPVATLRRDGDVKVLNVKAR
jgi:hypothetical protein